MSKRIILVGRACAGKDYLRKKFEARGFKYQISYTTRPPREGEIDGRDYFFITPEEADRMTRDGEWYESVVFNGWIYGTSMAQFYSDDSSIFIMTPSGLEHLKQEDRATSFIIYLNPPQEVINSRMKLRNMPGDSAERRIQADIEQFKDFTDYDMEIKNEYF
jgi:guanylate kinase